MKRDTLKWILVAAVVVAAAAYLILSETPSKKEPKNKKEKVVVGHSKPFKIEPVEGITISAPKNALDKDREFKLTAVSDEEYDRAVEVIQATKTVKLLMVMELDAGLKPNQYLPGDYEVEFDLDAMGIPRSLQEKVVVYRGAENGKYIEYNRYSTRINNGKLKFWSNQNSQVILGLRRRPNSFFDANPNSNVLKNAQELFTVFGAGGWNFGYFYDKTYVSVSIQDTSADFTLHFRFKDTEDAARFDKYLANDKAFGDRLEQLEQEAHRQYQAQFKDEVKKEQEGYKSFAPILKWFSKKQVQAIKDGINEEEIFDKLAVNDSILAKLNADPDGRLPKSIDTIISYIIRGNKYLNDIGLHKLNAEIQVFLMDATTMGQTHGVGTKYLFSNFSFFFLNYAQYSTYLDQNRPEHVQATVVHELFHIRQQMFYAMIKMSSAPAEATAAVLESDATKLWYNQGLLKIDPGTIHGAGLILTDKDSRYMFGTPFDKTMSTYTSLDAQYTMSEAIMGIREGVGKQTTTMEPFMTSYSFHGPHVNGWSGWIKYALDINDEQFDKGWVYFAATHLNAICNSQENTTTVPPKAVATTRIDVSEKSPVIHLKKFSTPKDYTVNTYYLDFPFRILQLPDGRKPREELTGSLFLVNKGEDNPYINFYISPNRWEGLIVKKKNSEGKEVEAYQQKAEASLYSDENSHGFYIAAVTTTQSKGGEGDYYAVVLFAPDTLKIRSVKEDQIRFVMPKPAKELTKNKLITGAVVTYAGKNGDTIRQNFAPKYFGDKVKWTVAGASKPGNGFSLSVHWYYQPDQNTTYVSPESKATTWGVKEDQQPEEISENMPKTNYWKQVKSTVLTENSGLDTEKLEGQEFVSSDFRFVEFKKESDQSIEMQGYAAINQEGDERIYERMLCMDGSLTATAPPKFWVPGVEYQGIMEVDQDPYIKRHSNPFEFKAEMTTSSDKACQQSRRAKIDTGRSNQGSSQWLRKYTGTFMARHPEGDAPRFFTFTQTYTVAERPSSDRKAKVTFTYDYEWVGEEEPEPEVEEETVPEGGYWKLVRTKVDDSNASGKTSDPSLQEGGNIKGEKGTYTAHGERIDKDYPFSYDRVIRFEKPKNIYLPGEKIELEITNEAFTVRGNGTPDKFPYGKILIYNQSRAAQTGRHFYDENPRYETGVIVWKYGNAEAPQPGYETKTGDPGFYIQEEVESQYCTKKTIYYYEWVEDGKTAESVKDEPSQEDQENFLDITEIQFYCHTNEPYGKGVVYTTYDHQGVSYKFKKTGSSSTFNGRHYDSEDVFTTTRSGDYQIVTAKFRQNKFDGSKANVDGYRSGGDKTCVDEEFTLTLKIAKDRSVEGTFSGTRKTLAGAGSWPEVASTCNMSISGSFGPEKIKDNDYSHDFTTINSFSYSVGGFQAYFKRADGTMPTNVDNTREFKFSTTSTNARICLSIFGTK